MYICRQIWNSFYENLEIHLALIFSAFGAYGWSAIENPNWQGENLVGKVKSNAGRISYQRRRGENNGEKNGEKNEKLLTIEVLTNGSILFLVRL